MLMIRRLPGRLDAIAAAMREKYSMAEQERLQMREKYAMTKRERLQVARIAAIRSRLCRAANIRFDDGTSNMGQIATLYPNYWGALADVVRLIYVRP